MRKYPPVVLLALAAACSGGDKIVAAGSGNASVRLSVEDSVFLANLVASQAISNFKNLRLMQVSDVVSQVGGALPAGCRPTLTGTADTNGNGISEDQTLTFASATCSQTQGNATSRINGTVRLQDLGGLRGYRTTYTGLSQAVTIADTTLTVEVTGALEVQYVSATSGRTSSTVTSRIIRQERGGSATLTLGSSVTSTFTPTTGQIAVGRNLPAGAFNLTGSVSVGLAANGTLRAAGQPANITFNIGITTAQPMAYDGTCLNDRAFLNGQLRGSVTGYAPGSLATGFAGCGQGVTPPPGVKR